MEGGAGRQAHRHALEALRTGRDDAFNAMVAAFKAASGTEMNVFSESFEDVQPKASVAANTARVWISPGACIRYRNYSRPKC